MHILADENIPLVEAFFASFGTIQRQPGRAFTAEALAAADVLLVRSVTQVDARLLAGSPVRFVGTCTIGTDHLDLDYLAGADIAWASAPGCNARGVVDYVLGSLLALAEVQGVPLRERCYGVVGAGQVGGRLVEVLRGLGWRVLVCDPPRAAREEGGDFVDLPTILAQCDVISLHTPLTGEGQWPTRHLLGAEQLALLKPGAWLVNASRGEVVDNTALREVLQQRPDLEAVLDVWEGEPQVDVALAERCRIATPHIAGYSLEGKARGTAQIYRAFCEHLGVAPAVSLEALLPPAWLPQLSVQAGADLEWALAALCRVVYDPRRDDASFRRSLLGDAHARRQGFDALRKHYPPRREIDGLQVRLQGDAPELAGVVRALGAQLL